MHLFGWLDGIGDAFDRVRFGADPAVTGPASAPTVTPMVVPPLEPGKRLEGLPSLFRFLGSLPAHEVEARLRPLQAEAARQVGQALEEAPLAVFRVVKDTIDEATSSTVAPTDPLLAAVRRALGDPRSAQEAAAALELAVRRISIRPSIARLVDAALEVLEDKGALGSGVLHTLGVLGIGALGVGGAQVVRYLAGDKVMLGTKGISRSVDQVGDVSIGLDRLGAYTGALRMHDPAWAGKAVELVVSGSAKALGTAEDRRDRLPTATASGTFPIVRGASSTFSVRPSATVDFEGKEAKARLEGLLSTASPSVRTSSKLGVSAGVAADRSSSVSVDAGVSATAPLDVRKRSSVSSSLTAGATARVSPAGKVTPEGRVQVDTTLRF